MQEELAMLDQALCHRIAGLSLDQRMPEGSRTRLLLRLAVLSKSADPLCMYQDQNRKLHNGKARVRPANPLQD